MKSGLGRYALVGALLCAAAAAWTNWRIVQSQQEKQQVVKVVKAIQPFTPITKDSVKLDAVAKDAVPEGAVLKVEDLDHQYSRTALMPGDIVRNQHLVPASGSNLSARLAVEKQTDMRAMAIQVNASTSVAGTVQEGDPVDVLVAIQAGSGNTAGTLAKIIAQRVPVLLVQKSSDGGLGSTSSMTVVLQVTPQQAEEIAFAQAQGLVWLITSPYNTDGTATADTTGVDLKTFLARYGTAAASAAAPAATPATASAGAAPGTIKTAATTGGGH